MQAKRISTPKLSHIVIAFVAIALSSTLAAHASGGDSPTAESALTFLWLVVILLLAKISSLVERIGQPPVLGELLAGVVIGNLFLIGLPWLEPIKADPRIRFLAQLGVVILLFQVGLETDFRDMLKVGVRAFLVACVGVVCPFLLATVLVGPYLLPGLSANAYLFLGATLTATSVGITARVFSDLGKLQKREAQIVLGAAVIDDVLGLMILAVVAAIANAGSVSIADIGLITVKAVFFLVGAIVLGLALAPRLGKLLSRIHTGIGMKLALAISFGLVAAFLAEQIGLAPIVGAFAAGLVLEPVHFRDFEEPQAAKEIRAVLADVPSEIKNKIMPTIERHVQRHIEDLVAPIGQFLVPIFFVMTGVDVRLNSFFNLAILLTALGITIAAFVGKVLSGLVAGKVNKSLVGWGMVPRGEVGLIFAATGRTIGVVSEDIFSMLVIVILLSTLLTPPILTFLLKKEEEDARRVLKNPAGVA